MTPRIKVYELSSIFDDPRYEGFASKPFLAGALPRNQTHNRNWKKLRLLPTWKPVAVTGRVRKFNDFPRVGLMPAFSQRAVDALRDFLEPNGELLPLKSPLGSYFAYNVTTIVDALDVKHSKIRWMIEPFIALVVEKYRFKQRELEGRTIFHLRECRSDIFVTEPFVQQAQEHGLNGMNFKLVWPLPPGVSWAALAKLRKEQLLASGLPAGQSIKGNTVVLRFHLGDAKSKGTRAERRAITELMDELDALLVNVESEAPPVGSLEGHDYGVAGECRLFVSCPDADALGRKLRPWLKNVNWPSGITVVKRYANFRERDAL